MNKFSIFPHNHKNWEICPSNILPECYVLNTSIKYTDHKSPTNHSICFYVSTNAYLSLEEPLVSSKVKIKTNSVFWTPNSKSWVTAAILPSIIHEIEQYHAQKIYAQHIIHP